MCVDENVPVSPSSLPTFQLEHEILTLMARFVFLAEKQKGVMTRTSSRDRIQAFVLILQLHAVVKSTS